MSSTLLPPPCEQLCNRSCSNKTHTLSCNKHTHQTPKGPLGGDPAHTHTLEFYTGLGSIPGPKREEPGKTGAPCVKVPGSSRVSTLLPPPHANSFVVGPAVIKHTHTGCLRKTSLRDSRPGSRLLSLRSLAGLRVGRRRRRRRRRRTGRRLMGRLVH
jgi:hypothetical protein